VVSTPTRSAEAHLDFLPRGGNLQLMRSREKEILAEGPAGTGKTRTALELVHLLARTYPKLRALITRKHQVTLTSTALVTFNEKVLHPVDGVAFFGGNKDEPAAYRYGNGSRIVVGGMDNASKILSSEYDIIYVNEATELSEEDWETLTTRLRNGVLKHMRIIGDCNPAHSRHWLNRRCQQGKTQRIRTRLEDNPAYFDDYGRPTTEGAYYLETLNNLTGTRRQRLRDGLWVGDEHTVYDGFLEELHVRPLEPGVRFVDGAYGVDYGMRHLAAVVAVSVDQYGRRWVREAWGEPSDDHGRSLARKVAEMREVYKLRRGRTDPNQDVLAGNVNANTATRGPGTRNHRIMLTKRLFSVFAGGRVFSQRDEALAREVLGPFSEPDSPGLIFVQGAPGIEELIEEVMDYHYVPQATDTKEELVVARINDDRIAALEYAIEELEEAQPANYESQAASVSWGSRK
jgi:hypothetical protein